MRDEENECYYIFAWHDIGSVIIYRCDNAKKIDGVN